MKIVVVNRPRSAFFAISIAFLAILTPLFVGYAILSGARSTAAGATECTWTGAGVDNNWSTAANWNCDEGSVPEDGTALAFPYAAAGGSYVTLTNDLVATNTYTGLLFTGNCDVGGVKYTYNIEGNTLHIAGDVVAEMSSHVGATWDSCQPSFDTDVVMESNGTIERVMFYAGGLGVNNHDVSLVGPTLGVLSGSGNLTVSNYTLFYGDSTQFTGTITIEDGTAWMSSNESFGAANVPITIGTGGRLSYWSSSSATTPNPITVESGALVPALTTGAQMGDGFDQDEIYARECTAEGGCGARPSVSKTFSGTITLHQDMAVEVPYGSITFTGTINGNGHGIVSYDTEGPNLGSMNDLIINSSSNNSTSANGTYAPVLFTTTLADTNSNTLLIGTLNKVVVNGQRGDIAMIRSGILSGSGTVGSVEVLSGIGARLQPGENRGTLSTGNVSLNSDAAIDIELGGTNASEFDQLNVTGTVNLAGAALNVSHWDDYVPVNGDSFIIINNDGADAITGTFAGLSEGADVVVGDVTYTISYVGGTGNDVVLTTEDSPGPPNTAGVFGKPMNLLLPAGIIAAAGLALLARWQFKRMRPLAVRK